MFDQINMQVPFWQFYKVERQLGVKAIAFRVTDKLEDVITVCQQHATDYWAADSNYRGYVNVAFVSPRDALVSKLHFVEEVEPTNLQYPQVHKPIRQIGLLQACSENYLHGLLSTMARKKMNSIVPNCFKNYGGSQFIKQDIEDAIRIKRETKAEKLARADRAPEELKNVPTKSLLHAYRTYRFDYDGLCSIGKRNFFINEVKAVLDTREHVTK